ncbi:MAG: hypothetical protein AMXMBFR26_24110 [Porticoccaceae bacterium]
MGTPKQDQARCEAPGTTNNVDSDRRECGRRAGLLRRVEPARKHRPRKFLTGGLRHYGQRHRGKGGDARRLELSAQENIAEGLVDVKRVVGIVQHRCNLTGRQQQQQQRGPGDKREAARAAAADSSHWQEITALPPILWLSGHTETR